MPPYVAQLKDRMRFGPPRSPFRRTPPKLRGDPGAAVDAARLARRMLPGDLSEGGEQAGGSPGETFFSGLVITGNIADFRYASAAICTNYSCINPPETAAMSFLCIFAHF
ncbi:hypothetical protein AB4Y40_27270 [Paraburkholderia sp. EG287B]|uniref:hypothetical protein n=1 Tax=Paraburkholderia sp. EG287B TaxID=3237010 RepID=UPI0034D35422